MVVMHPKTESALVSRHLMGTGRGDDRPACRTAATIAGARQARFHFGTMRSASVS
jgi:hypothetical protein